MKTLSLRIPAKASSVFVAILICLSVTTALARASGTVVVRQNDGHVDTYSNVSIKIAGNALFMRSSDKQGTLVIPKAACSYRGKVLACYPTTATLIQAGEAGDLTIKTGVVYLNLSASVQTPPGSSAIAAHSISLSLQTAANTRVTSNGRIDEVDK